MSVVAISERLVAKLSEEKQEGTASQFIKGVFWRLQIFFNKTQRNVDNIFTLLIRKFHEIYLGLSRILGILVKFPQPNTSLRTEPTNCRSLPIINVKAMFLLLQFV